MFKMVKRDDSKSWRFHGPDHLDCANLCGAPGGTERLKSEEQSVKLVRCG